VILDVATIRATEDVFISLLLLIEGDFTFFLDEKSNKKIKPEYF
jgi:hypothetical protein